MSIELTKQLLTDEAEKAVAKLVKRNGKKTATSQVRKFYDDFTLLQTKAKDRDEEEFRKDILPMIAFTKAKLAYCVGRDELISNEFQKLISDKIDAIGTKKDFDNFMLFYQAVIGYAKFHENDTDDRTGTGGQNRGNWPQRGNYNGSKYNKNSNYNTGYGYRK